MEKLMKKLLLIITLLLNVSSTFTADQKSTVEIFKDLIDTWQKKDLALTTIENEIKELITKKFNFIYDPSSYNFGETPLIIACRGNNYNIAKFMLEGPNKDLSKNHLLSINDSITDHPPLYLTPLNKIKINGWTALDFAHYHNNPNLINLLEVNLAKRFEMALTSFKNAYFDFHIPFEGLDRLHKINQRNALKTLKELIEKNTKSNLNGDLTTLPSGQTALILACRLNDYDLAKFIIEGPNEYFSKTARKAIDYKISDEETIFLDGKNSFLSEKWIDIKGWTALDIAIHNKNNQLIKLIKKYKKPEEA